MADIRINALATTAASTASDDFVAVDGSANGTRKLNAYSPTFGGNLTVSGTGTSSVAGTLNVSGGFILNRINAKGIYTGTSDNCGFTWTGTNGEFSTASGSLILKSAGTTALTLDSSQNATFAGTLTTNKAYQDITSGLSTIYVYSTDTAAQDKGGTIQLGGAYTGTTTTTFGGVRGSKESTTAGETGGQLEFFTRANGGAMTRRAYISSAGDATFAGSATVTGRVNLLNAYSYLSADSSNLIYETYAGKGHQFKTGGTTALTIDSGQNATFSGDIRFSSANAFDIGQTGARVRTAFIKTLVLTSGAPAAANSTGTAGTVTWDANYIYVCTATDTWKRVAIATWP